VSTDLLSHSIDLAHFLNGPIASVTGIGETFIKERPLPSAAGTHYDRGSPGDPTGRVTNEDWFGAIVRFENGSRLEFAADAERRADENRLVVKYSYRQPFGCFSGSLDGIQLAEGIGVMEHQDAVW